MEKAQREKHSITIRGLHSKENHSNRSAHEGETTVRLLKEKHDVVKLLTNEMNIDALSKFKEAGRI